MYLWGQKLFDTEQRFTFEYLSHAYSVLKWETWAANDVIMLISLQVRYLLASTVPKHKLEWGLPKTESHSCAKGSRHSNCKCLILALTWLWSQIWAGSGPALHQITSESLPDTASIYLDFGFKMNFLGCSCKWTGNVKLAEIHQTVQQ